MTDTPAPCLAALGPAYTFSEIAAKAFSAGHPLKPALKLYPTIRKVFKAVETECAFGILPIENMVEGYVQPVLDSLLESRFQITGELLLPIQFSFVSNSSDFGELRKIHVQFATQAQCSEFLDTLPHAEIITTHSNGTSLRKVLEGGKDEGAVIPAYALRMNRFHFPAHVENVTDHSHNQTRFIVIEKNGRPRDPEKKYKTSIIIIEGTDRPGMLSDILSSFSKREINLISIMSRPTKESLGKYHFFIDIDGHSENPAIRDALAEIHKCGEVKVLGTYPRAGKPLVNLNRPAIDLDFRPFDGKADAPGVFVASGADPYRNTREVLSRFDLNRLSGKKVLLKPNIGRNAEAGSGVVTNPHVVAAALDAFLEAGAEVAVGESPIVGVRLEEAFEKCGLAAVARERNCRLIDMDRRKPVMIPIPDGRAIETLKVCADLFDFDFVVSIPVMKMHMHTGVSLGVKNMKGCLWGRSKVDLHMLPPIPGSNEMTLNIAIADMASVLRPHLTIVDGSVGMEGLGPSAGDPKKMDLVIAGTDALAVDATACRLMQVDPESVPHLKMAAQRGYGVIEGERIRVHPRDWIDRSRAFAPAPVNLSIRFPGVRILDENSCSACQSTLLLFLKRYGEQLFEYFPEKKEIQIAIGKGHKDVPWGTLCIGNCARRHCDRGPFVSGCPPVASAILKVLREHRGISGKPEDGPEEE